MVLTASWSSAVKVEAMMEEIWRGVERGPERERERWEERGGEGGEKRKGEGADGEKEERAKRGSASLPCQRAMHLAREQRLKPKGTIYIREGGRRGEREGVGGETRTEVDFLSRAGAAHQLSLTPPSSTFPPNRLTSSSQTDPTPKETSSPVGSQNQERIQLEKVVYMREKRSVRRLRRQRTPRHRLEPFRFSPFLSLSLLSETYSQIQCSWKDISI